MVLRVSHRVLNFHSAMLVLLLEIFDSNHSTNYEFQEYWFALAEDGRCAL